MSQQKKLFLIDAYTIIFRAYYAFIKNPRINSQGLNTSAIFGFVNFIDEILKKEKPTHIAVVLDAPAANFRHDLFPQYKANRQPTPEDIKKSVPYIKQILEGYNIKFIEFVGFEADDVIGTLAKKAAANSFQVFMVTTDKDYNQLVDENIFIYKIGRSSVEREIVDVEKVKKAFDIKSPSQFIDILAIMGDTADNVPGIMGVGEKTAIKLISEFESIDGLFKNLHKVKGKIKEKIAESFDLVALSKKLVTIDINVPIDIDFEELCVIGINKDILKPLFEELEFIGLMNRILNLNEGQVLQGTLFPIQNQHNQQLSLLNNIYNTNHDYEIIDTAEKRMILISSLLSQLEVCFDTETTGLDIHQAELVGLSFAFIEHTAYYVPIPPERNQAQMIIDEFKTFFESETIIKIGQNLKFDISILKNYGVNVRGELFDTMIAHYLLQPDQRHNLDYLASVYLKYSTIPIEKLIGNKAKIQTNMRFVPIEKVAEYAAEDADITLQLKNILVKDLKTHDLFNLAKTVEMPLIYILADMEYTGVMIDIDFLKDYNIKLSESLKSLEKEIYELAGIQFNLASPKQLGEVLFDRMKIIPNPKKTKTNQYATGEEELVKLLDKHLIIKKILEYRTLQKLLTTYIQALPKLVNSKTSRIHTSYNQAVTATGRLSSNNPNLQNIPIRTEEGRIIRKAFVPSSKQHILLDADYSQIELRLIAHLSGDKNMIEAFQQNLDIHKATAAKIFNVGLDEVTKEMRNKAKSANFGIIYGISSYGLAENLSIGKSEAKSLIDNYFLCYPDVKLYMDNCIKSARDKGYIVTIMGRRRNLSDINSKNAIVRGNAERNAINAPVQGSAADVIKIAMLNIFNRFAEKGLISKMIQQVHDELVFDVFLPELELVRNIVKYEMENALKLSVPLLAEVGIGDNWLEAH